MRFGLIIIIVSVWINVFGQIEDSFNELLDCEKETIRTVNKLVDVFNEYRFDSFDIITNKWIEGCGISECTQRYIVINNIINNKPSENSIQTYFENDFQNVFRNRINHTKKINYGYIYSESKSYFGYVPLRHSIDSIIIRESLKLLDSRILTKDERLICTLFTGDVEGFEKEIEKSDYNESNTKQLLLGNYRKNYYNWMATTVHLGVFRPLSSDDIFSYSPMLGFTFSSPLQFKIIGELGLKFRINTNDKTFQYKALGAVNTVNSHWSMFFGGFVGYKIYESEKCILIPKIGFGLEEVDTGLSDGEKKSEDKEFFNVSVPHLSLGMSGMVPVFKRSYLGMEITYHYCPYQLDSDLQTKIDNHLLSTELFYRF